MKRKNKLLKDKVKKLGGEPTSLMLTLVAPLIISVISLIFGAYQYFDKRQLERTNEELTGRAKALEIEQKKLEVRKEEIQHQPSLEIQYLESDTLSIYLRRELIGDRVQGFDRAFLRWISQIEKRLPYSVSLSFIRTAPYEEIVAAPDRVIDARISMFLIRNAGTAKVSNISMNCTVSPSGRIYPINVAQLESNKGVIFVTEISNRKTPEYYGTRLIPGTQLKYFDQFNNQQGNFIVREPFEVPIIINPGNIMRSVKRSPDKKLSP